MVHFDEGETRNGKILKLYWVTLEVKQEDCDRQNKRKGKREQNGEYLITGIMEGRTGSEEEKRATINFFGRETERLRGRW